MYQQLNKLHSVVIKEDPAEQMSPTFVGRDSTDSLGGLKQSFVFNNQIDMASKMQTNREKEPLHKGGISKININFMGDGSRESLDSRLVLQHGTNNATPMNDSPRDNMDQQRHSLLNKQQRHTLTKNQSKKTLRNTNSTSNLETVGQ